MSQLTPSSLRARRRSAMAGRSSGRMSSPRTTTHMSRRAGPPTAIRQPNVVTFSTLYRKTTGGTVQHVRDHAAGRVHEHQCRGNGVLVGHVGPPSSTRCSGLSNSAHGGTGLATNNVGWARIDITATTPLSEPERERRRVGDADIHEHCWHAPGEQDDNPPVLIGDITNPSATIAIVDAGGNVIRTPVLQNVCRDPSGPHHADRRHGDQVHRHRGADLLRQPDRRITTVSAGGNAYRAPVVTDDFIRLSGGDIADNGTLTVTFNTTPNCVSGTYIVATDPSTNATQPTLRHEPVRLDDRWYPHRRRRPREPVDHEDRLARSGRDQRQADLHDRRHNAGPDRGLRRQGRRHAPGRYDVRQFVRSELEPAPTPRASSRAIALAATSHRLGTEDHHQRHRPGHGAARSRTAPPCRRRMMTHGQQHRYGDNDGLRSADLTITKTDSPDPVNVNGTLTYTINVINNPATVAATRSASPTPSRSARHSSPQTAPAGAVAEH